MTGVGRANVVDTASSGAGTEAKMARVGDSTRDNAGNVRDHAVGDAGSLLS